jgi:hypothetical protein
VLSERELSAAIGSPAYGPDGEKIGTVEHFFTDDRTGAPTWVAVSTGLFGTRHSVVPATDATFADGSVRLPVTKDAVRTAPSVSDQHLAPEDEALLRQHYRLDAAGMPQSPDDVTTHDLSQLPPDAEAPSRARTRGHRPGRDARGDRAGRRRPPAALPTAR